MDKKRQNTSERRLAQVRALKERYFSEELTVEERLAAKDARIQLLETEVAELKLRLERLEARAQRSAPSRPERPNPPAKQHSPLFESEQAGFDFYRD